MTSPSLTCADRCGGYRLGVHQLLFHRLRMRHLIAVDVVAALAALAIVAYAALDADTPGAPHEPTWLSWLVATAIAAPIAVRRLWPMPALGVAMTTVFVCLTSGLIPVVAVGAPLGAVTILLYLVASVELRWRSASALAACLVAFTVSVVLNRAVRVPFETWTDSLSGLAFGWLVLAGGWTIGLTSRERRLYHERTAGQRAQQAVAEERLRIARELHDIVAHSMSLIAVKAGIGNHVAAQRPQEARDALRVIEATSRSSLTEMRHLLGVLRSEVDSAELSPVPGPDGIPALADRARSAGVTVTLDLGDTSSLPDGIGLSVYRIVQEALTNVVRHAAPARCRVRVEVTGQDVRIEVANDGPRQDEPSGTGHGLIGMRERVAMYGGTFGAGPRPDGGFLVSAILPLADPS